MVPAVEFDVGERSWSTDALTDAADGTGAAVDVAAGVVCVNRIYCFRLIALASEILTTAVSAFIFTKMYVYDIYIYILYIYIYAYIYIYIYIYI